VAADLTDTCHSQVSRWKGQQLPFSQIHPKATVVVVDLPGGGGLYGCKFHMDFMAEE